MAKETQAVETEANKQRQPNPTLAATAGHTVENAGLRELLDSPLNAVGDGMLTNQAAHLGNDEIQVTQRQAMAARVGQAQGNQHLQRVVEALQHSRQMSRDPLSYYTAPTTSHIQRQREAGEGSERSPVREQASDTNPGGSGYSSVTEAIRETLRQYQEMPIDVPETDPRRGGERAERVNRVLVRVPYFINTGRRLAAARAARAQSTEAREALSGIPMVARVGKGSPAQVRAAIQGFVNQGLIRAPGNGWPPNGENIRAWMQQYGIGVDCSGFIYWALWQVQASRGREQAAETWAGQFRSGGRVVRGYGGLLTRGAERIQTPTQLVPGDIASYSPTSGIGHYRIVMQTRHQEDYFYYSLAESSGSMEGPNIREMRAPVDAEDFSHIEIQSGVRWRRASQRERSFLYYRRAETSPVVGAVGQPTERRERAATPTDRPEERPPTGGTLPGRDEVYDTPGSPARVPTRKPTGRVTEGSERRGEEGATEPRRRTGSAPMAVGRLVPQGRGYQYGGRDSKTYTEERVTQAAEYFAREGYPQLEQACRVFLRLAPLEGYLSAINTWDSQIFTWGAGFAAGGQLGRMWRNLDDSVKTYLGSHPAASRYFGGGRLNITNDLRTDTEALQAVIYASENDPYREYVLKAQLKTFFTRTMGIAAIPERRASFSTSNIPALSLASHMNHWLPAFFAMPGDLNNAIRLAGGTLSEQPPTSALAAAIISIQSHKMLDRDRFGEEAAGNRRVLKRNRVNAWKPVVRYIRNLRELFETRRTPLSITTRAIELIPSFQLSGGNFFVGVDRLEDVPSNHYVMLHQGKFFDFGARGG